MMPLVSNFTTNTALTADRILEETWDTLEQVRGCIEGVCSWNGKYRHWNTNLGYS